MDEWKQELIIFVIIDMIGLISVFITNDWLICGILVLTASIVVPIHRSFELKLLNWS